MAVTQAASCLRVTCSGPGPRVTAGPVGLARGPGSRNTRPSLAKAPGLVGSPGLVSGGLFCVGPSSGPAPGLLEPPIASPGPGRPRPLPAAGQTGSWNVVSDAK